MKALIDLDPLLYRYGNCSFEDGDPMPDHLITKLVDDRIEEICDAVGAMEWVGYISGPNNFRYDIATILPYKGNREGLEKPAKYAVVRQHLIDSYECVEITDGYEADDAMSILQYRDIVDATRAWAITEDGPAYMHYMFDVLESYCETIICTVDKDLMMVPGWHYNYQTDEKTFVTPQEGLRFFYKQLLTGDPVDNIKGLFGVGKSSKLLKDIDELETEEEMYSYVREQYVKRFGNYADQFLLETGRLLWMKTTEDDLWSPPENVKQD